MEEKLKQPRKNKPAQNHQKQTRAQPAAMRKPNENTNTKNHNPIWKNVGFSLKFIQHKEHSSTQALFRTHFATPFFGGITMAHALPEFFVRFLAARCDIPMPTK